LTIAAQLYEARQYPAALGQLAIVVADQTRWALPGATRAVTVPVCRGGRGISRRY